MEATEIRKLAALEDTHWWYRERRALLDRALRRLPSPARASGPSPDRASGAAGAAGGPVAGGMGRRALDIGAAGGGTRGCSSGGAGRRSRWSTAPRAPRWPPSAGST
ncbi:hypothetical protein ACFQ1L_12270 [Phytohabitans flavus]|uniref:hypothetical protein n=1 Tax=Phytohabitans flavus TaxID=1076124 RepID=UPI00363C7C84